MATTRQAKELSYTVRFEPAEEGGYVVTVPSLPGIVTEGDTLKEARARAKEAIRGHLRTGPARFYFADDATESDVDA